MTARVMTTPGVKPLRVVTAGVVLLFAAGCGVSSELVVPDGAGGEMCIPSGEGGHLLFAFDFFVNEGSAPAQVVSVELVSPENLEVTDFATLLNSEDGHRGAADGSPESTVPDGASNPVPPDESVLVQASLRLQDPSRAGTAVALKVSYQDAGEQGPMASVDTVVTIEVNPPGKFCPGVERPQ